MANQSNDFNTPPELIEPIKRFWNGTIELDPCSNKHSMVKAIVEWGLPINSLNCVWHKVAKTVFVNPPFAPYYLSDDGTICLTPQEYKERGDQDVFTRYTIRDWVTKGIDERDNGVESIYLIPARGMGSTVWQRSILPNFDAICFLKSRYPFWENGAPCKNEKTGKIDPPTFDIALVYFCPSDSTMEDKVHKAAYLNRFRGVFTHYGYVLTRG